MAIFIKIIVKKNNAIFFLFQLEDAEFSRTAAVKAKQNIELELSDVQQQLDDIMRSKSDVEDRLMRLSREKTDLSSQLEENEEELQEVMKKYKASVSQLSVDQVCFNNIQYLKPKAAQFNFWQLKRGYIFKNFYDFKH